MELSAEYFRLRKNLYGILSSAFYKEPDKAYLEKLKKFLPVFGKIISVGGINEGEGGLGLLSSAVEKTESEAIQDYECAFAKLFLSIGLLSGEVGVVSQESVYLSSTGLSMQEPRDEVLEIYYSQGVNKIKGFTEPDDHISAELAFMAHMSSISATHIDADDGDGLKKGIEVQKDFIQNHLLKWVPKMCTDICERTKNDYYKGLALLLSSFLKADEAFLKDFNELLTGSGD